MTVIREQDFITSIADRTNATLDPELETFYLMDVFAVRLPTLAEDAGRARALGPARPCGRSRPRLNASR